MDTTFTPPRPQSRDEVVIAFGAPGHVDLALHPLPHPIGAISRCRTHLKLLTVDQTIWKEIDDGGYWHLLHDFGGCFAERANKNDPKVLSLHCWAIAKDLNTLHNPNGQIPPETFDPARPFVFTQDHPIVMIFEKHGYFWGGRFAHTKDPMHMQFATGT